MTIPHQPEAKCDGDPSRLPSDAGPPSRPDTGDVSVSGLAGMIPSGLDGDPSRLPSDAGRAHPRPWLRVHEDAGPPSRPDTGNVSVSGLAGIKRAMVLAAGLGLRMRPLTLTRPKPLLTVAGRTLLDHGLDRLAAAGIETAVVNSHYLGEMIETHLANRSQPTIQLSPESTILETGGGVKAALPYFAGEPFLVVNADILWLDGPVPAARRLAAAWNPALMDALLLLVPVERAHGYHGPGDYHLDAEGRPQHRGNAKRAPLVFAGLHIVRPEAFAETPDGAFSARLIWDRAEATGRLYGLIHDGEWFHVGTPADLAATEQWFEAGKPLD